MKERNNFTRCKVIKVDEVPKIIECIKEYGLKILSLGIGGEYKTLSQAIRKLGNKEVTLAKYVYINLKDTVLEITTKWYEGKSCTYKVSLNDEIIVKQKGQYYFSILQKYFKIPKIVDKEPWTKYIDEDTGKFALSASPIIGFNPKYNKQELKDCYEYDLNSAYGSIQLDKIPDLQNPIVGWNEIGPNQIGFVLDDQLTMYKDGYADVVFNLIPCPEGLNKFIHKYYKLKKESKGELKSEAKATLNIPVGYCQRWNPFFRAYIVHSCNEKIYKLIDENTLFWNTDAIFSKVKREDLDIGEEIGQFKEIKCESVRYDGNVYQINDEIPVYRGVPKKWFEAYEKKLGRKYNLLLDGIPEKINIYFWNWKTLEMEINEIWQ